jgi:hypothetical protein
MFWLWGEVKGNRQRCRQESGVSHELLRAVLRRPARFVSGWFRSSPLTTGCSLLEMESQSPESTHRS